MSKTKSIVILINLFLLLAYFNWSIADKEKILTNGHKVLLELAPIDPRSLLQGDYMRLNYKINETTDSMHLAKRGYCIIAMGENGVANRVRFQQGQQPLKQGELAIKYFSNSTRYFTSIHIGAESYFFEEGQSKKFQTAKYGCLKIDDEGNSVLEGLYDANYQHINY